MDKPKTKLTKRFWSKVDVRDPDDCWNWTAGCFNHGYGAFGIGDTTQPAHRVVWALTNGPIPEGMCVLHKCDNKICCNPDHLFLGTRADNNADRDRKGRTERGERHHGAKLTEADVIEIRIRYRAGGISQRALAAEFGIHQVNIGCIVRGETWTHLLEDDSA